jgi:tryptophan-rich sensory protein
MQLAQSQTCNHIPASIDRLDVFWWVFAVRGGFAALFALLLLYAASLLGSIFFDPVMFVFMGLLLGFYILGNGVLLGVAARVAYKNHRHIAGLLLSECVLESR